MQKIFNKQLLTFGCVLMSMVTSIGQVNNPVKVETQIAPPVTPFVLDYVNGNIQKLYVNLLLTTDAATPTLDVKLHLTIESNSNNVRIETTKDPVLYSKIKTVTLERNILQIIDVNDLREYFDIKNLVFTGTTAQEFVNTNGQLTDGVYKICFDAYARRGNDWVNVTNALSAYTGCKDLFITYNDPPMLNMPEQGATIASLSHDAPQSQNIIFNWVPRHPAGLSAIYSLEIFEIPPGYSGDPNVIVNASTPRFTKTVYGTTFDFNTVVSDGFLMLPNRDYAYRVKVQPADGGDPYASLAGNNLFKNNGYSEVRLFHVEGPCVLPEEIDAEVKGEDVVLINYKPVSSNTNKKYVVRYRKLGTAFWEEEKVDDATSITLTGLKKSTTYEYMLSGPGGTCFNSAAKFTTSDKPANQFVNCGEIDAVNDLETTSLPSLLQNGNFKAGSFTVVATTVSGSNGVFSGSGHIAVPLFYNAGVKVTFTDVHINAKGEMNQGVIETSIGDIKTLYDFTRPEDNFTFIDADALGGKITNASDIVVGSNTITVTIKNPDGTTGVKIFPYTPGAGAQIKDNDGNVFNIDKDGNVSGPVKDNSTTGNGVGNNNTGGNNNGNATTSTAGSGPGLNTSKVLVTFKPYASQYYGFDDVNTDIVKDGDATIKVCWKSMSVGGSQNDFVNVEINIKDNSINKNQVKFKTLDGIDYSLDYTGDKIQLKPATKNGVQQLYAYYTQGTDNKDTVRVGKLNIVSYETITKKVMLIPLTEKAKQSIAGDKTIASELLNSYYKQALVKWEVSTSDVLEEIKTMAWDINKDELLDIPDKDDLDNYTGEMAALNKIASEHYNKNNAADDMLYIFIGVQDNQPSIKAAFPLHGNFGYIFSGNKRGLLTIAHELGHGAFKLRHSDATGNDNMMTEGAEVAGYDRPFISKPQWDSIRMVRSVIAGENTMGDGAASSILIKELKPFGNYFIWDVVQKIHKKLPNPHSYTFLTPSGYPITIDAKYLKKISFTSLDGIKYGTKGEMDNEHDFRNFPNGTLISFEIGNNNASNKYTCLKEARGYYYVSKTTGEYIDTFEVDFDTDRKYVRNTNVILGFACMATNTQNNQLDFKTKIALLQRNKLVKKSFDAESINANNISNADDRGLRKIAYKAAGLVRNESISPIYNLQDLQYVPDAKMSLDVDENLKFINAIKFLREANSCHNAKIPIILNIAKAIEIEPLYWQDFVTDKTSKYNATKNDYNDLYAAFIEYRNNQWVLDNNFITSMKKFLCAPDKLMQDGVLHELFPEKWKLINSEMGENGPEIAAFIDALIEQFGPEILEKIPYLGQVYKAASMGCSAAKQLEILYAAVDKNFANSRTGKEALSINNIQSVALEDGIKLTGVLRNFAKPGYVKAISGFVLAGLSHYNNIRNGLDNFDKLKNALNNDEDKREYRYQIAKSIFLEMGELKNNISDFKDYNNERKSGDMTKKTDESVDVRYNYIRENNQKFKLIQTLKDKITNDNRNQQSKYILSIKKLNSNDPEMFVYQKSKFKPLFKIKELNNKQGILPAYSLVTRPNSNPVITISDADFFDQKTNSIKKTDIEIFEQDGKLKIWPKGLNSGSGNQNLTPPAKWTVDLITLSVAYKSKISFDDAFGDFKVFTNTNNKNIAAQINEKGVLVINENEADDFISTDKIYTLQKNDEVIWIDIKGNKTMLKENDQINLAQKIIGNFTHYCFKRGACFIAGTKVSVKKGFKNIEDVKVGDSVYAYNEQSKKSSLQKVLKTFVRSASSLVKIFVGKDTIQATPEHPFYTSNGWMNAGKLMKGVKVLTLAGSMLAVDSVFAKDTVATVYNFEVEKNHTYYVGENKILVHNICLFGLFKRLSSFINYNALAKLRSKVRDNFFKIIPHNEIIGKAYDPQKDNSLDVILSAKIGNRNNYSIEINGRKVTLAEVYYNDLMTFLSVFNTSGNTNIRQEVITRLKKLNDKANRIFVWPSDIKTKNWDVKELFQELININAANRSSKSLSWQDIFNFLGYEIHHALPVSVLEKSEALKYYYEVVGFNDGFSYHGERDILNTIPAQPVFANLDLGVHNSHLAYNDELITRLDNAFEALCKKYQNDVDGEKKVIDGLEKIMTGYAKIIKERIFLLSMRNGANVTPIKINSLFYDNQSDPIFKKLLDDDFLIK
jgi:hypothetical protein